MPESQLLRQDLTESRIKQYGAPHVGLMFKAFSKSINGVWEDYCCIEFYLSKLHDKVKDETIEALSLDILVSEPTTRVLSKNVILGIFSRIKDSKNGPRAFADAVAIFEHFIADLASKVYLDYPIKLKGLKSDNSSEDEKRRIKLMNFILESNSIDEVLSKVVEEKIRGIFYGNPVELFSKDKAKIGFNDHFSKNYDKQLKLFAEITARRNVIVHSVGRVDRKYLSEVSGGSFKLGEKVSVDAEYLKAAIYVFKQLAAAAADQVATNMYGQPLNGRAARIKRAGKKRKLDEIVAT